MENIMTYNSSTRLTDALERDLLAKAMEDQFRFRPFRSVSKLVTGIASFAAKARAQMNAREMF